MDKKITYLKGDATAPSSQGVKIIAHICNDIGGWGAGFVLSLSKKWKEPEQQYGLWRDSKDNFRLGEVRFVRVESDIYIANMIGQKGVSFENGQPPIRYEAVEECLKKVSQEASRLSASVHMPRIGCGLAGGKWEDIEPIIDKTLTSKAIEVFVYDIQ